MPFDVFQTVSGRFTLRVTDSLVVTTWAGEEEEVRVPLAGGAIPIIDQARRVVASAKWDGGKLQLERQVEGCGTIVDVVEAIPEGDRLLVVRTVKGVPGAIPEIRLVFDRVE